MNKKLERYELSVMNKMLRFVWNIVWVLLFRPTPKSFHFWRILLLRIFGSKLGVNCHVYPSAKIWAPWNLIMGDRACLAEMVDCYCVDKIQIGADSTISQYCFLCTATHDYSKLNMPLLTAPIIIGTNVWITSAVYVGPGVSIGKGTVVGVRSAVFSDLPPWVVAFGSPAKPMKTRVIT